MKYLILGASGFIGTNIVNYLLSKTEHTVILYDRLHRKCDFGKKMTNRVTYVTGEFSENVDFSLLTQHVDIIIHLISTTTPASSNADIEGEIKDNVFPTLKLLDACVVNKVKKIVFISSGGTVYGNIGKRAASEDTANTPICSYGIQKLMIEKYLQLYRYKYNLKSNIIRLSNPYGPHQNPQGGVGAVTAFVCQALKHSPIHIWGDGNVVRDYIYIDDVIKGIINICEYDGEEQIFNLGTGCGHSLKELLHLIENALGREIEIIYEKGRNVDLPYSVLDISLYNKTFSHPQFCDLKQGIEKMIISLLAES